MTNLFYDQWLLRKDEKVSTSLDSHFAKVRNISHQDIKNPVLEDLLDPFLFDDMTKSCQRIKTAIDKNERIMIFGDYDLDGMSGAAQLFLTLKNLGAQVSYRLPSRSDGYGLSKIFIDEAIEKQVKIFITTDCGISNREEIEYAHKNNIDFIVTDHHSVPEIIPPAYSILHPLVPNESFPDKDLTGAGVAYFFCSGLLRTMLPLANAKQMEKQLLEIAILGTIADCGPLRGQNRIITILGLDILKKTKHKGIKRLFELSGTNPELLTAESIAFFIAPRLNSSGRLAHPRISLELLVGNANRADELESLNTHRQEMVKGFLEDIEEKENDLDKRSIIILKNINWIGGIIGLISGKLAEQYGVPTIICEQTDKKLVGSCRGPEDFHFAKAFQALQKIDPDLFISCGGHAQAAGFSILPEKFKKLCDLFTALVIEKRGLTPPPTKIKYDGDIMRPLQVTEIKNLSLYEPFGVGNPSPLFAFEELFLMQIRCVGKSSQHLSFSFQNQVGQEISAILFHGSKYLEKFRIGNQYTLLAVPEIKTWNNNEQISLKITDIQIL